MFVPVACLTCGKLFQVPEAAAGTDVPCPWCKTTAPALPVAGVAATPAATVPHGSKPVADPEPLSLDDDPVPAAPQRPREPFRFPLFTVLVGLLLVVLVSAATVAVLGYGSGRIPASAWAAFTPPDGSCTVALPGPPTAEKVEPTSHGITLGGERFVTTEWYSGATAWVGWQDLDPGWAKRVTGDRDGVLTTPVLEAERDRRKEQCHGAVTKEATVRFGAHLGLEVQMATPRGQLVERYMLSVEGKRPRLYVVGVEAKNAAPNNRPGPAAERLFNSFKVQ